MSAIRSIALLSALLFALFSTSAHAEYYSWWYNFNGGPYKSAIEACSANGWTGFYPQYGPADGFCTRTLDNGDGTTRTQYGPETIRKGDSCADGTTYDTTTGGCSAPTNSCAALKDTQLASFRWDSNTDDPPSTISNNGCAATVTQARCSYVSAGKAVCTGRATYTGDKLDKNPNGSASDCTGDACTTGSPKPETKSQDCVYSSDGSGSSSCTATNSQSNPGTSQCGSVNGAYKCIENPKATAVSNTLNSTKTPTTNSNGTLTIVQDDTVTTVKCSGRSCTTTKTNSSGTTVTTSSGQVVSHNSTCSGPQCSSTGTASPSTGSGTGTGTGTGTGAGESEEGDDEGASAGTLTDPSNGTFDGQASDWDGKIDKAKKDLKDGIDKIKDSFKPLGDVSLGGGGGQLYCPPATTIPYLNITLNFCLNEYASSLQWLSSAIFAGCALLALFIVFA